MLGKLRRIRLLTWLLLLGTPGLAGTVLQAAHPCPVDAPWLAQSGGAGHGDHAGHAGHDSAPAGDHEACSCLGACQAATPAWSPAAAAVVRALLLPPAPPPAVVAVAAPVASRPLDRLPPSTAPPVA